MSSIRAKFIRGEEVKYISHLDLMKVFERAIRRANIPISYSQGFNPHPQMVFGLPLSVGVTSEREYVDIDMDTEMKEDEFIELLNSQLPLGLKILDAKHKKTRDNIMSSITMASYDILVLDCENMGINIINKKIGSLMSRSEIIARKEGKKGARNIDIKPMIALLKIKKLQCDESEIHDRGNTPDEHVCSNTWLLRYVDDLMRYESQNMKYGRDNVLCLSMLLSAGSAANLKPELLIQALNEAEDLKLKAVKVHRTGLFIGKDNKIQDPLSLDSLV